MDENQEKEPMNEKQEPETELVNLEANNQEVTTETQNEEPITEKKKGNYITGTIGAILGGFVASIPWILTYSFANMIVAALAILIAGGAFLGYKIFKGKMGKGVPTIITIVSLLVVTIVTTIICPTILMARSGYPITFDNLKNLYVAHAREDVRNAIIQDLVVSLLFTIIGIAAIIKSISAQIKSGKKDIKFNIDAIYEEMRKELKEQNEVVKKACQGLNCMSKENKATKQEILNELEMTYNVERKRAKQCFATCSAYKLLKKHKGKYYYDETDEQNKLANAINTNTRRVSVKDILVIIIVVLIIGGVAGYIMSEMSEVYTVPNTNIKLEIGDMQVFYGTEEEITNAFGEEASLYYDFIINDKNNKYELYGQVIDKSHYEGLDFATIIKEDKEYYAPYIGEDVMSEILDKQFGDDALKCYNYTYEGTSGEQYRAIIFLYEAEECYLWINVYTDLDVELTTVDTIIDDLLK